MLGSFSDAVTALLNLSWCVYCNRQSFSLSDSAPSRSTGFQVDGQGLLLRMASNSTCSFPKFQSPWALGTILRLVAQSLDHPGQMHNMEPHTEDVMLQVDAGTQRILQYEESLKQEHYQIILKTQIGNACTHIII